MNVLVIGGTGFIGSHVVRLLVENGHRVAVLHRGTRHCEVSSDIHHIHCSRDALDLLRPELNRFRPTVVLDIIPYTERQARKLMSVFRGMAQRVVVLSSADVYRNYDGLRGRSPAPPDPVPLSEEAPLRATRYPYRGSGLPFEWADRYDKILVERVVMASSDLPATVLRLPAVYGPGDPQHRVAEYIERMRGEQRILMTAQQAAWRWTRGYVENVAAAIALTVVDDRAAGRIYNVGEASASTEQAWLEEIGRAIGWAGSVEHSPAEELPDHLRPRLDYRYELVTDTTRLRDELGYEAAVDRTEAIRRTIAWEHTRRSQRS